MSVNHKSKLCTTPTVFPNTISAQSIDLLVVLKLLNTDPAPAASLTVIA